MLILAILVFGLAAGWIAHLLVGRGRPDWGRLFVVGIAGSFVGGLIGSLLAGDGLDLRPSGLIGSAVGATILLLLMRSFGPTPQPAPAGASRSATRRRSKSKKSKGRHARH